ncbi:radical SAM protein [Sphingomonas sanguinis]|jgi:uncharacterized Fe-S cluster-containing radical SAM superfamily protein|uniref:4Fe-4S cluster-binding domain-containing protein n=1 Tax=Sphingomonas sanguinis TaxID=33051 RepID=A0A7Y7QXA0_9SPHN|nr:radical SAM protein [Sphingomonas sanguinis]MBZ6383097.1 radical SAM protein [Sphingomonas sanguinis]NNG48175.1 4Fe-4S cluster-binding domain-containing protein [Sphingomonas sanguinis]NNG54921.1 4Fe-4S cluster-binding domain-containing protein [Sphingomonas sanguinis]NVP32394.1 4Fe-4S cluster-binding domain-containing protein [Sphingomonas sanguinis]
MDELNKRRHNGVLWVYVSGSCNFRCAYCIDDRYAIPHNKLDEGLFLDRLDELQRQLQYTIVLTGGEPMAQPRLVHALFDRFSSTAKTVQTNGSLTSATLSLCPKLAPDDWISISYHDFAWRRSKHEKSIDATVEGLLDNGKNVFVQLMCTPDNAVRMSAAAVRFSELGCKVAMRRIHDHTPESFGQVERLLGACGGEDWALPAFFGREHKPPRRQPFRAANVYLDGTIGFVCKDEVIIGNLYSGYDLNIVDRYRSLPCDQVCGSCSCLWVSEPWGFA